MEEVVTRQHAHPNPVYHLYAQIHLGYSRSHLAYVFSKSEHMIGNWLRTYHATESFQRARATRERRYTEQHRVWLVNYYQQHPLSYLDEAQDSFRRPHGIDISKNTVWRIIHSFGLTWKVLERRALHVKENNVIRLLNRSSLP